LSSTAPLDNASTLVGQDLGAPSAEPQALEGASIILPAENASTSDTQVPLLPSAEVTLSLAALLADAFGPNNIENESDSSQHGEAVKVENELPDFI
jgi:hypothetical protein